MCVGYLAMVDAVISGVVYSRDPASPDNGRATINVVSGPALHVVDGSGITDHFSVARLPPHKVLEKELRRYSKEAETSLQQEADGTTTGTRLRLNI